MLSVSSRIWTRVTMSISYNDNHSTTGTSTISTSLLIFQGIGLMSKVFANGPNNWGSIQGWVIPKTQKMVFDATLFNTQHYKVRIKGKGEQSREWSSALPLHLVVVAIKKEPSGQPWLRSPPLLTFLLLIHIKLMKIIFSSLLICMKSYILKK